MYLAQGWRVAAILLFSLAISSCGSALDALPGGKSGVSKTSELPGTVTISTVSGVAQDGRVVNGTVRIFAFNGTKGEMLGTGLTDPSGRFSIDIQTRSQPILVEVSGGRYKEETTAAEIRIQDDQALFCVLIYEAGKPSVAVATYYSTLATGLAEYLSKNGASPVQAILEANRRVAAILGIDSLNVIPADVTNPAEGRPVATSQLEFGFATAAISSLTEVASRDNNTVPHQVFNSIKFIQDAYDDVRADGVLDGNGTSGVVSLGRVSLSAARYRHELALHILRSATIETANRAGLPPKSLLRVAESLNNSIDPIFGGAAVVPLDSEVPNIFSVFAQGKELRSEGVLFGTPTITASVMSLPGIDSVEILLDGSGLAAARDPKNPLFELSTTDIPDGLHKLTLRATDVVGGVGSSTFDVVISNKQTTIKNISIANGDYLRGQVRVNADINDPVGLARVEYLVDERTIASNADPQPGLLLDVGTLSDGSHNLRIVATNAAGVALSAEVQFFADKTSPEVLIFNPPSGSSPQNTFLRGLINLDAMVTDVAFESAEIFVNGRSQSTVTIPSFSVPIDTTRFLDGENALVVRAVDKAGNTSVDERRVVFDNTAPVVMFSSPAAGGRRLGGMIEVQAIISDAASGLSNAAIRVANTQGFEQNFPLDSSGDSFARSLDSTRFSGDGPYQISIAATDRAGNASNSSAVDVIVDNTGPDLNLSVAAGIGVNRGGCVVSGRVADSGDVESVMFRVESSADRSIDLRGDGSFEFFIPVSDDSPASFTINLDVSAFDRQENVSVATRALEILYSERARFRNRVREAAGGTTEFDPEVECSF